MVKTLLDKFLSMLSDSTITQSILVLTVFGTITYCIVTKEPIPDILSQYGGIIIGFFFGAKAALMSRKEE